MLRCKTAKQNKVLAGILLCVMLFSVAQFYTILQPLTVQAAAFDGGDGTAANPYRISNISQFSLITLGDSGAGKYYVLTTDISTASTQVRPLMDGEFHGVLDGNGKSIALKQSLCSNLMPSGIIKNLNFSCTISGKTSSNYAYTIAGNYYACAIAGSNAGLIDNCHGSVNINEDGSGCTWNWVSSLVGCGNGGTIRNCGVTNSELHAYNCSYNFVGGLIGQSRGGFLIDNCYFKGCCCGTGNTVWVGSAVGHSLSGSMTIRNTYCYNTGTHACSGSVWQGAIGNYQTAVTFNNFYFGNARNASGEPVAGHSSATVGSGYSRVTSDPAPIYTAENTIYRKWSTGSSFASYASNSSFGRTTLTLDTGGGKIIDSAGKKVVNQTLTKVIDDTLLLPSATKLGFAFLGWASTSDSTIVAYPAGSLYYGNNNATLYAVWEEKELDINFETLAISNKDDLFERPLH